MEATPEVVEQVQPETNEQAQPPSPPQAEPKSERQLKFSIGDVMEKSGIPRNIREKIKAEREGKSAKVEQEQEEKKPVQEPPTAEKVPEAEKEEPEKLEAEEEEEIEVQDDPRFKRLLKRIDKKHGQFKAAEERATLLESENETLKQQLDSASPIVAQPTYEDPLAAITNVNQLKETYEQAKYSRDYLRRMLAGPDLVDEYGNVVKDENGRAVIHVDSQGKKTTREEVTDWLGRSEDMINDYIPAKASFMQQKANWDKAAYTAFPDLFKRGSDDQKLANQFLRENPEFLKNPKRNWMLGVYLIGEKALQQALNQSNTKNGQPAKKPETKSDLDERFLAPKPPIVEEVVKPPTRRVAPASMRKLEDAKTNLAKAGGNKRSLRDYVSAVMADRQKTGRKPAAV